MQRLPSHFIISSLILIYRNYNCYSVIKLHKTQGDGSVVLKTQETQEDENTRGRCFCC